MVKTYPNQKIIKINKSPSDKEHKYTKFNIDCLNSALQNLSGNGFKLYCYFNKNKDNFQFALSSKDTMSALQFSNKTFYKCISELIENGYLAVINEGSNIYIFTDCVKITQGKNNSSVKITQTSVESTQDSVEITQNRVKSTQTSVESTEEILKHDNIEYILYDTKNHENKIDKEEDKNDKLDYRDSSFEDMKLERIRKEQELENEYQELIVYSIDYGKDIRLNDTKNNLSYTFTVLPETVKRCGILSVGDCVKISTLFLKGAEQWDELDNYKVDVPF
jgi:hypothetical protein